MSARNCASVWAATVRPTGPATAEASPPSVNSLSRSFSAPRCAHDQHDHVGGRPADLKAHAPALDTHGSRRGPAAAGAVSARDVALSVLAADDECSRLQLRDDHDAVGLLEQLRRNALVRRAHDLGQHGRCFVQAPGRLVVLGAHGRKREYRRDHRRDCQSRCMSSCCCVSHSCLDFQLIHRRLGFRPITEPA